jgi:hypothetical protein
MELNPNVLMDLARIRHQEMLVAAQRARLARSTADERSSSLEPLTEPQLAFDGLKNGRTPAQAGRRL